MKPLSEIYKNQYFKKRYAALGWRAPIVCGTLCKMFPEVRSVIDVGCAVGDLVEGFLGLGLEAKGLEGSSAAFQHMVVDMERIIVHDLREPFSGAGQFDLAVCFEVAEHIEPEHADVFAGNLAALASKWLVVSAAPPGQGGTYHVNCQPRGYWVDKFAALQFKGREDLERQFREAVAPWRHKPGVKAYYDNVLVFERA